MPTRDLAPRPVEASLDLSVVIPVYNEEALLHELHRRLKGALEPLGLRYEVILVNDGSRDATPAIIAELCAADPSFRAIHFSRNFGHQAAVTAGLDHAGGAAVLVMDADLQDPPELVGEMLARLREGWHVVYGVRRKRKEGPAKRLAYWAYYRLLRTVTNVEIPLDAGDFALLDRRVVLALRALPERNRFVRGIRSWVGFRQTGLEYERDARYAGEVKYTFTKLVKLALDGIVSFSYAPLRVAVYLGLAFAAASFLIAAFFLLYKLAVGVDVPGWTSLVITVLFMGGLQLLTMGVMGEYVSRIYDEVKQRPVYVVAELANFPDAAAT
jgi:dolichol-phosphate mannosyltransferase